MFEVPSGLECVDRLGGIESRGVWHSLALVGIADLGRAHSSIGLGASRGCLVGGSGVLVGRHGIELRGEDKEVR